MCLTRDVSKFGTHGRRLTAMESKETEMKAGNGIFVSDQPITTPTIMSARPQH